MDDNLVYALVDETTTVAVPSVIDTLTLTRAGEVPLRADWQTVESATEYRIYRSDAPQPGGFEQRDATNDPTYLDLGGASDGETWFYLVRAVNACGDEGP